MAMHSVEFTYNEPAGFVDIEFDIDPDLSKEEKETCALLEIKGLYPEAENIEIVEIKEV